MKSFKHFITEALDFRVIKGDNQTVYRILHPKGEEHGYQDVVISHSSKKAAVPVANLDLEKPVGEQPPKFGGANAIRKIINRFEEDNPHVKKVYAVPENPEHSGPFQRILSKWRYKLTNKGFKLNESTSNTVKEIMNRAEESAKITPAVADAAAAASTFKKLPPEMEEVLKYMKNNPVFEGEHRKRFDDAISALNIGRENKYNNHLDFLKNAMEKHQVENM